MKNVNDFNIYKSDFSAVKSIDVPRGLHQTKGLMQFSFNEVSSDQGEQENNNEQENIQKGEINNALPYLQDKDKDAQSKFSEEPKKDLLHSDRERKENDGKSVSPKEMVHVQSNDSFQEDDKEVERDKLLEQQEYEKMASERFERIFKKPVIQDPPKKVEKGPLTIVHPKYKAFSPPRKPRNIIVEKPKEEKEEIEEEEEEDDESSYSAGARNFEKEEPLIMDQIKKDIQELKEVRKEGINIPSKIFWEDPVKLNNYNRFMQSMSDYDILGNPEMIFIPPSKATINGIHYETPGYFLDEISDDTIDKKTWLQGYHKVGFELHPRLVDYSQGAHPLPFPIMMKAYPFLFQSFGATYSPFNFLSKPNPFTDLRALSEKRVAFDQIKKMLGIIPKAIEGKSFSPEVLSLFYLDSSVMSLAKVSPNIKNVNEILVEAEAKKDLYVKKNREQIEMAYENPKEYFEERIKGVQILPEDQDIVLISEHQIIQPLSPEYLAETNKTSFTFSGPDKYTAFIAAYLVEKEIPRDKLEIMLQNYVGTGSLEMIGERYNKSLEIYNKSNSPECKTFHSKYYKENFKNFLNEFGYYYEGPKVSIPNDVYEFTNMLDYNGAKLNNINPHAKGSFTSKRKRLLTAYKEIEAGLSNWCDIENDNTNKSFQFFYMGFKKISAKLKDEIHSYDKPPRFYNPTMIAAFIPFQLVFNKVFDQCQFLSEKCPHSLLGISDTHNYFNNLMDSIYNSKSARYHYSDNFWIKEGDDYVSVDVKRCDSNLSLESLYYPLRVLGKMVLDEKAYEKFKIIADLFVKTIPRDAIFSMYRTKQGSPEFINMVLKFFWLPSGVVGTAYFNHLFTGLFLYYTKDTKWIKTGEGLLTPELKAKAENFGIQLEVASYVNFAQIKEGDVVPFDLLGRSALFIQKTFLPLLEENRVWKSMFFIKKQTYDAHALVANFVRLAKMDSLIQLGAFCYPILGEFIYSCLVAFTSVLRNTMVTLTREQAIDLAKTLDGFNMDPVGFSGFVFKGFIPSCAQYFYEKTGKRLRYKPLVEFDKKLATKLDNYYSVWASLLPVINGKPVNTSHIAHAQYSSRPYFVANYFAKLLEMDRPGDRKFSYDYVLRQLIKFFGPDIALTMAKELNQIIRDNLNSVIHPYIGREFNKSLRELGKSLIKKGVSNTKANMYIKKLYVDLNKINRMRDAVYPVLNVDKNQKPFIEMGSVDKAFKHLDYVLRNMNVSSLFGFDNYKFWDGFKGKDFMQRLNLLMSRIMFDGMDIKKQPMIGNIPLNNLHSYREFPYVITKNVWVDPKKLKYDLDIMILNSRMPPLNDLGMLSGIIANVRPYIIDKKPSTITMQEERVFEKDKEENF